MIRPAPDVRHARWPGARIAHGRFPPWRADDAPLRAEPGSLAIGYNGQRGVVVRTPAGATSPATSRPAASA